LSTFFIEAFEAFVASLVSPAEAQTAAFATTRPARVSNADMLLRDLGFIR
jgi:hypothetical protein